MALHLDISTLTNNFKMDFVWFNISFDESKNDHLGYIYKDLNTTFKRNFDVKTFYDQITLVHTPSLFSLCQIYPRETFFQVSSLCDLSQMTPEFSRFYEKMKTLFGFDFSGILPCFTWTEFLTNIYPVLKNSFIKIPSISKKIDYINRISSIKEDLD